MVLHDKTHWIEDKPWFKRKERNSQDVKSSRRAPPKKDGHGGGHTWSGPEEDAIPEGFLPHAADQQLESSIVKELSSGTSSTQSSRKGSFEMDDFHFDLNDFPALGRTVPKSPSRRKAEDTWATNVMKDMDLKI
ncbi:unnamed protein product [Amoebophrya sp. A120]|nr:unnamed protein product [Amoebophrya sp. A120]|eukprot:GSA120T00006588001.1